MKIHLELCYRQLLHHLPCDDNLVLKFTIYLFFLFSFLWWVSLEMKEGIKVRNWCIRYVCLASLGFKFDFKHTYIGQNLISVYQKWSDHSRSVRPLSFMELDAVNWRSRTNLGPLPHIPHVLRRHRFHTQDMFVRMWQTILLLSV